MGIGQTPTEFQLGFLVGMIEGEGEINIVKKPNKGKNKNLSTYHARITVSNTAKELLDKVYSITNAGKGHLSCSKRARSQDCYRWDICQLDQVYKVISMVRPLLVSKRKKKLAELVDRFCTSRFNNRHKPYTDGEIELHRQAKIYNRRGTL